MTERNYANFASPLPHPGEHLAADFMPEYGLSAGDLARAMGLSDRTRVERLVRGRQAVSADTALRLALVFGTTPDFWLNLQAAHDLSKAAIERRAELKTIKRLSPAA